MPNGERPRRSLAWLRTPLAWLRTPRTWLRTRPSPRFRVRLPGGGSHEAAAGELRVVGDAVRHRAAEHQAHQPVVHGQDQPVVEQLADHGVDLVLAGRDVVLAADELAQPGWPGRVVA